jgi:acyl-CoA synthetase (AMP-forming)/AMP-acid ligase II
MASQAHSPTSLEGTYALQAAVVGEDVDGQAPASGSPQLPATASGPSPRGGACVRDRTVNPGRPAVLGARPANTSFQLWGESVVACVVADDPPVDVGVLDEFCRGRIAGFKRPKRYHFLETLPKNNKGKVLRTNLRTRFAGPSLVV